MNFSEKQGNKVSRLQGKGVCGMERTIMITPDYLRKLADEIENAHKYHDHKGYAVLKTRKRPNGEVIFILEQESSYPECNSTFYEIK